MQTIPKNSQTKTQNTERKTKELTKVRLNIIKRQGHVLPNHHNVRRRKLKENKIKQHNHKRKRKRQPPSHLQSHKPHDLRTQNANFSSRIKPAAVQKEANKVSETSPDEKPTIRQPKKDF